MSHKITNRLPHLCNVVHSWVFMSVIFMTVSKIKCQSLEMIDSFLGEKTKIIMKYCRIHTNFWKTQLIIYVSYISDKISNWYFEATLWLAGAIVLDILLAESAI